MDNNLNPSDDDDLRLFEGVGGRVPNTILRVKHSDPEVTSITLANVQLVAAAWIRLGDILESAHLKELFLIGGNVDVNGLSWTAGQSIHSEVHIRRRQHSRSCEDESPCSISLQQSMP